MGRNWDLRSRGAGLLCQKQILTRESKINIKAREQFYFLFLILVMGEKLEIKPDTIMRKNDVSFNKLPIET